MINDTESKEEVNFDNFEIKKEISGKTDKPLGSRQGKSKWYLFTLYNVEKKLIIIKQFKVIVL